MKQTLTERIAHYDALLPRRFDAFPRGFELRPADWAMTDNVLNTPPVEYQGGLIRPLLEMDVEFLSNEMVRKARSGEIDLVKNYPCGLNCPGCFSEEDVFGDRKNLMYWQQVMEQIDDARKIGLHSIKFLGPGELFQNPDLFDILDALQQRNIPMTIFTKGAELGSDHLAAMHYGHLGIRTADELAYRIAEYNGVRIGLGFNSFFPEVQDRSVGSTNRTRDYSFTDFAFSDRGVADYTKKRDNALVNLIRHGFAKDVQNLNLVATPVTQRQYLECPEELPAMLAWAADRNIPLITAPSMEAGPKSTGLVRIETKRDPVHTWTKDFYVGIYSKAIEHGITTMDRLRVEGVSAYAGTSPCNQVPYGVFLRLNGQIKMCPGTSLAQNIFGNTHETPIAQIWTASGNYAREETKNNWCPAKSTALPDWLPAEIMKELEARYR